MAHEHAVRDNDPFFSINDNNRSITYESKDKLVLVQGDHKSEVFTFSIPRHVDGHDMLECDLVQIHFINIASNGGTRFSSLYRVTDLHVLDEDSDETLLFTWLIHGDATQHAGTLTFVVRFACTKDGVIEYAWNTDIYSSVSILSSINNEEVFIENNNDILEAWRKELIDSGLSGISAINEARDAALGLIAQAGGLVVSDTEPEHEDVDAWVKPNPDGEYINLLTDEDIAHELSDAEDKVPSVALLKRVAEQGADLGDIDTALDSIIAIQEKLINGVPEAPEEPAQLITFTITLWGSEVVTYEAVEGMDWDEWCDSDYNTDGYYADYNVYASDGVGIVMYEGSSFHSAQVIIAGGEYRI